MNHCLVDSVTNYVRLEPVLQTKQVMVPHEGFCKNCGGPDSLVQSRRGLEISLRKIIISFFELSMTVQTVRFNLNVQKFSRNFYLFFNIVALQSRMSRNSFENKYI